MTGLKSYFGKVLQKNNSLKYCISAAFLLMEGYVQGALRKYRHIASFVERFKTTPQAKFN